MTYSNRINNLRQKLTKNNLDGLYVTNLTNVRYLTGFTGSAGSLLVLDNEQYFFTDGRYIEQSKEEVKNCKIHIVSSAHIQAIKEKNILASNFKIGFESNFVNVNLYDLFRLFLSISLVLSFKIKKTCRHTKSILSNFKEVWLI